MEVQDSYKATVAMANSEVELVVANSGARICPLNNFLSRVCSPDTSGFATADIARAFSRAMPARLIYICEELHNAEALLVQDKHHAKNGGPIRSIRDLIVSILYVHSRS